MGLAWLLCPSSSAILLIYIYFLLVLARLYVALIQTHSMRSPDEPKQSKAFLRSVVGMVHTEFRGEPSSGSNVIPRRARPGLAGLAGLGPHVHDAPDPGT